jgi:ferric-dicitrate binding protein FerR (iron transport regulator)
MSRSERIAILLVKFKQGTITEPEKKELMNWVDESEQNKLLFEQLTDEIQLAKEFREYYSAEVISWEKIEREAGFEIQPERDEPVPLISVKVRWVIAATVIGITGLIAFFLYQDRGIKPKILVVDVPVFDTVNIVTRIGKRDTVDLPDGSVVQLNAASRLVYTKPFSGTERKVVLDGEAYFEVAENPEKPFIVQTVNPVIGKDPVTISVLGTQFNVKAYNDGMPVVTTVVKGRVRVQQGKRAQDMNVNEQIAADSSGQLVVHTVNAGSSVAWKKDSFDFEKGASVRSVMNELKRWYGVKVEYRGEPQQGFVGSFPRRFTLKQAIDVLRNTDNVILQLEDNTVTVIAKNKE